MFKKILIANRGEIASRIAKTLQEMGITAAALYSDADRKSPHLRHANELYRLEGKSLRETYLSIPQIIEIAKAHRVDAIHPGYGFLSENPRFAKACEDAKITFIGPSSDVIAKMGDKLVAKQMARKAKVPVVPGWESPEAFSLDQARKAAKEIGYPVLIKAAAGGGGKGVRQVRKEADLEAALSSAAQEAESAFGDRRVFLEKYIERPRHVEIQIFGDRHGSIVHLFERECSVQRRFQKVIEESPSPALTPKLRKEMGEAALRIAKETGYVNAGTVEFMLDEHGAFYFLEMNTRLQVEHSVTELTTGRDLVRLQVGAAAGEKLPFSQNELIQSGHAIECRVYAEDPWNGFLPSAGKIARYVPPVGPGIRVDGGVDDESVVSIDFDPMLAKLIVFSESRRAAIQKMAWALRNFVVLGVTTNIEYLQRIVEHPEFTAGDLHTHFLEEHRFERRGHRYVEEALVAAAVALSGQQRRADDSPSVAGPSAEKESPWVQSAEWRLF